MAIIPRPGVYDTSNKLRIEALALAKRTESDVVTSEFATSPDDPRLVQIGDLIEVRVVKAKKADDHAIAIEQMLKDAKEICPDEKIFEQWKAKYCPALGAFLIAKTQTYRQL